ncbi:MAG: protein-disulfide reductase DsbD domain-containing protein [Pyrinomonadaceae bacterium]
MNPSARIRIGYLLFLFIASACSKPAQNEPSSNTQSPAPQRITSESVVKVSAQPVAIARGESGDAVVRLTIQSGYHTNANPPTFPYLIATQLDITAGDGISVAFVSYPNALTKEFAFADKPLAVYEGETELRAKLKADSSASKGEHSIAAQLRVQACDHQVCYPPGQIGLRIPVTVK